MLCDGVDGDEDEVEGGIFDYQSDSDRSGEDVAIETQAPLPPTMHRPKPLHVCRMPPPRPPLHVCTTPPRRLNPRIKVQMGMEMVENRLRDVSTSCSGCFGDCHATSQDDSQDEETLRSRPACPRVWW